MLLAATMFGCSRSGEPASTGTTAVHKHEHHPPHGGTPVVLGDEANHVELVLDPAAGILQAYVLDGEMENFVRIPAKSVEIDAKVSGNEQKLELNAVPNTATGETVGNTSMFQGQAGWLKSATNFDAVLKEITIHGTTYSNVTFNFPKGNDEDAK